MSKFIDIRLSTKDIELYGIAVLPDDIKTRYEQSYEKYGEDEEFFFTVYGVAVTDWALSKNAGKKVKSVSSFVTSYLSKETKRKEKGKDIVTRKKAGENVYPDGALAVDNGVEEIKNSDTPSFLNNIEKKSESEFLVSPKKVQTVDSDNDNPFPVDKDFSKESVQFSDEEDEASSDVVDVDDDKGESEGGTLEDEEPKSDAFLDLISDEDDDEVFEDEDELELQDFEKHGKKRSSLIISFIVLFSVIIIAGIAVSLSDTSIKRPVDEEPIEDFEKYNKNKVGNVESALNKGDDKKLKEQKRPLIAKKKKTKNRSSGSGKKRSGGKNKNTVKDEEILNKYSGSNAGAGVVRATRKGFKPGGSEKGGGVYIKGRSSDDGKETSKKFIHKNFKIKVKLQFSIRSTAATTVVAVVTQGNDQVPEGSKFYGNASGYVNNRTQIRFKTLLTAGQEFSVTGFAISGKDPGIPSEVTDVSNANIKAGVKQGVGNTASNILKNVTSRLSGGVADASSNTTEPVNEEYQKQEEANKMKQEYRVPAGTSFYIYLE